MLEKMSAAYSMEVERRSKLSSVAKQRGVKVAMISQTLYLMLVIK